MLGNRRAEMKPLNPALRRWILQILLSRMKQTSAKRRPKCVRRAESKHVTSLLPAKRGMTTSCFIPARMYETRHQVRRGDTESVVNQTRRRW